MIFYKLFFKLKIIRKLFSSNIENYNILNDGRNFCDQPINNLIKQYDEVRKVPTGQGNDYTTECLLDYACFKGIHRLIVVDLSKQKSFRYSPKINSTRSCWRR